MNRVDAKGRALFDQISSSREFAAALMKYFDWFSGVPDSVFKNVLPLLQPQQFAARENHAVGAAFGARIGGKNPCVLMQNSGLGLSLDAILGLFELYRQGLLLVVSNRGELAWEEIQHQDWGRLTLPLLNATNFTVLDFQTHGVSAIAQAADIIATEQCIVVLLVHRGNLDE